MGHQDPAQRRSNNQVGRTRQRLHPCGKLDSEGRGLSGVLQYERALKVGAAVQTRSEKEMALQQSSASLEERQHIFLIHRFTAFLPAPRGEQFYVKIF